MNNPSEPNPTNIDNSTMLDQKFMAPVLLEQIAMQAQEIALCRAMIEQLKARITELQVENASLGQLAMDFKNADSLKGEA